MAIEFQCEHCNTTLRVPDEHAGKRAKCPKCQAVNSIPSGVQSSQAGVAPLADTSPPSAPSKPTSQGMDSFFNEDSPASSTQLATDAANPYTAGNAPAGTGFGQPHRGSLILTLGIVSLVCNFMLVPGIMAWILGRTDLKEIDAGRMDPEGRGMTQAGMVLGIIGTALPLVLFALYVIFIIIVIVFAGAAAAAG